MAAFLDGRKKWIYWFISGKLVSKFAFVSLNPRSKKVQSREKLTLKKV